MWLIMITIIWLIHHRWCAAEHVICSEIVASRPFHSNVPYCSRKGRLMPFTCTHITIAWAWKQIQLEVWVVPKTATSAFLHLPHYTSHPNHQWPCAQRITLWRLLHCLLPSLMRPAVSIHCLSTCWSFACEWLSVCVCLCHRKWSMIC